MQVGLRDAVSKASVASTSRPGVEEADESTKPPEPAAPGTGAPTAGTVIARAEFRLDDSPRAIARDRGRQ